MNTRAMAASTSSDSVMEAVSAISSDGTRRIETHRPAIVAMSRSTNSMGPLLHTGTGRARQRAMR